MTIKSITLSFGLVGSKKKIPFAKSLRCMICHRVFYDDPLAPKRMTLHCPYCGKSYYSEKGV